jgi:hypothetical protein
MNPECTWRGQWLGTVKTRIGMGMIKLRSRLWGPVTAEHQTAKGEICKPVRLRACGSETGPFGGYQCAPHSTMHCRAGTVNGCAMLTLAFQLNGSLPWTG